jgi:hypothetical protein
LKKLVAGSVLVFVFVADASMALTPSPHLNEAPAVIEVNGNPKNKE